MARVLYISYTGMMEPLGQSQVLQYLKGLSGEHEFELISFEKPEHLCNHEKVHQLKKTILGQGIEWHPMRYHKRFSVFATFYDLCQMYRKASQLNQQSKFDLVHCRSYIPAITGALLKKNDGIGFLFDMRGFWADERVEGGIWPAGSLLYKIAKRLEKYLLLNADHIVSLTQAGIEEIKKFPYMQGNELKYSVISTCTNLETFRPSVNEEPGTHSLVVGVVGSIGTWYLFDEMLQCFKQIQLVRPDTRLLVVNKNDHKKIKDKLHLHQIDAGNVEILAADYGDMAKQISRMSFGLFFIKPVFSKRASAPTKLGEFLACGVPCLTNSGVGDVDRIISGSQTGVCLSDLSHDQYRKGFESLSEILSDRQISKRCRDTAGKYFSLDQGIEKYAEIYREINQ